MSITIELPADVEARLQADAQAEGRDVATVAVLRLAAWYAAEDAAMQAALNGPARRFDLEALRAEYGLPAGRSGEEIAAAAEDALARMDPEKRAEAERLGLL